MSARTDLAGLLGPGLPSTWDLWPYPVALDNIDTGRTPVIIEGWTITPHPIPSRLVTEFTLALLEPQTGEDADDTLDVSVHVLIDLLDLLAGQNLIRWSEATRATYRDQFPAYKFTVTIDTEKD
jgi:hypothetical protein